MSTPVFEDLTVKLLEQHWDDVPVCHAVGCDAPAVVSMVQRCPCRASGSACQAHFAHDMKVIELYIANGGAGCARCGKKWLPPSTAKDMIDEVPL